MRCVVETFPKASGSAAVVLYPEESSLLKLVQDFSTGKTDSTRAKSNTEI
jgi:hypothetical protein